LVVAGTAASHPIQLRTARVTPSPLGTEGSHAWVTIPRPERILLGALSPSVYAIVELFVEGKNRAQIARLRGTATNTVANQLSEAFRRVGVSGRCELLSHLARSWPAALRSTGRPRPNEQLSDSLFATHHCLPRKRNRKMKSHYSKMSISRASALLAIVENDIATQAVPNAAAEIQAVCDYFPTAEGNER
jgi:DNA-binding CsgD family transcriptional regulator